MNKIRLDGKIATEPEFSHECKGEKFYKLFLEVGRKSEVVDTLPCIVPEVFLKDVEVGECIGINGEIRTRNNHSEGNSKVEIYVFVLGVDDYEGQDTNSVELEGYVCKEPIYRETPLGRAISDLLIASNRPYGKSDYIPCIAWGRNALISSDIPVGSKVSIYGRLQSREYVKMLDDDTKETRVAYELSASSLEVLEESEETDESIN